MTYFQTSLEDIIRRLRWVMLLVMLIDTVCTLAGQPAAYWHDPSKADEIEPVVRFFLVRGVLPFAIGAVLYLAGVFCLVSVAPARMALAVLIAFLLAHFWGATSWLLYHFHYGIRGQNFFEIAIAALVTLALGKVGKRSTPALLLACCSISLTTFADDGNLLTNADFLAARPDGKTAPLHWYLEGNCSIATSAAEGAQIKVNAVGKKDGRLTQSFDVSAQSTYVVTAEIKGTVPQMAFLQIEFLDGGNEIKALPRLDSEKCGDTWTAVTMKVPTQQAKRISVIFHFEQTERTVGQTASLRHVRVVAEK